MSPFATAVACVVPSACLMLSGTLDVMAAVAKWRSLTEGLSGKVPPAVIFGISGEVTVSHEDTPASGDLHVVKSVSRACAGSIGQPCWDSRLVLNKVQICVVSFSPIALDLGCWDGWLVLDVGDVLVICLMPSPPAVGLRVW